MPCKKHTEKVTTLPLELKKIYKIAIRTAPKPLGHAKSTPKKCLTLPLESIKEDIQNRYTAAPRACKKPSLRDRCLQIPRTAAGFEPMPCKKHTEKVTTLPLESIKEDIQNRNTNSTKTIGRHPKSTPKKCLTLPLEAVKEDIQNRYTNSTKTIGRHPFQIPRTAAGFELMPCKKHTEKVPNVTFGIHYMQKAQRKNA